MKALAAVVLAVFSLVLTPAMAQTGPEAPTEPGAAAPRLDPGPPPPGPFGFAVKRPVVGGACSGCPWGALADKVKIAMAPLGYDVQVCHNCSGPDSVRIVDERRKPPPLRPNQIALGSKTPPDAPVDFGVTAAEFLLDAFHGAGRYGKEPARSNLRLLARIEDPNYYLVAVRKGVPINDLGDVKTKRLPVTIFVDDKPFVDIILGYYGITEAELKSWGGRIVRGPGGGVDRADYSIVMNFAEGLNNTPESGLWYALSQTSNMRFLQLPDDLLAKLTGPLWTIGETPVSLIRGMDTSIKTVVSSGTLVYTRADAPEQFAYDVAKALDERKDVLKWSIIPFSYEPENVWRAADIPLHPGAARYYRERGYMPKVARR